MKTQSTLQRTLKALFITGIAVFALASAHAEDLVQVTADNYVRAETDLQGVRRDHGLLRQVQSQSEALCHR